MNLCINRRRVLHARSLPMDIESTGRSKSVRLISTISDVIRDVSFWFRNGELYVDTNTSRCVYDLFAVVNHHGESSNSGHYTGEFPFFQFFISFVKFTLISFQLIVEIPLTAIGIGSMIKT